MRDRSAALVDVMSFLFLFAIVVFITATDGALKPPANPQRFLSISVTTVTPKASGFRLGCSERGAAENSETISLAVYLRMPGQAFAPADVAAEQCYPDEASNAGTAYLRLLFNDGVTPDAIVLFVSNLGQADWLGDSFFMDIEVHGNEFCARHSRHHILGAVFPLVFERGGSCA